MSKFTLKGIKIFKPNYFSKALNNGILLILLINLFIAGCGTKISENQEKEKIDKSELCYIQFYKINNQAKIYIDGRLAEDTGSYGEQEDSERMISLSKHLTKGLHEIKVVLINGEGFPSDSYDEYWEIYYELFLNGIPIDYMHEKNDHATEYGEVWLFTHEIQVN